MTATNFPSFVGIDSFDASDEIFSDLIDQDILLICLDSRKSLNKENFSFKGSCSMSLLHGHVQINGFQIKNVELDPVKIKPAKWYELHSPETNSFIAVLNKSNEVLDEQMLSANFVEALLNKIKTLLNLDTQIFDNLNEFLHKNDFSFSTSSLIAFAFLKSQMCNYISSFPNFKHVYKQIISVSSNRSMYASLTERLANGGISQYFRRI